MLLQIFSIFRIWVKDFVCKLSALLWHLLHYLLVVYVIFCVLESQGTREKRRWGFLEKKIKKTTLEHLFSFFLSPFSMSFFFLITISNGSSSNTQFTFKSQTMINMWRWVMLQVEYCHIHCWFLKNNFIVKYVRSTIISKVLAK